MNKRETHLMQGMSRDLSAPRFNTNMAFSAKNIRITSRGENSTLLAVTNERGTSRYSVTGTIIGTIIGSAAFTDKLVLFTTESGVDRIYRLDFNSDFTSADVVTLFVGNPITPSAPDNNGNLDFSDEYPLETLPVFENDKIQKVYWVDGINQPRMINIATDIQYTNPDTFNFNRKINGQHIVRISKSNTGGEFPTGTIQYCFNYYTKFGQETNLVDASPLYYLSPRESGLPADAISTSSFTINIQHIDTNYDYLRLYAIVRTSENATPNVRIVGDYSIGGTIHLDDIEEVDSDNNPAIVDFDNLYIVDGTTGERQGKVSDLYTAPEDGSYIQIDYGVNDYIQDISTGEVYCFYVDNIQAGRFFKASYIVIVNNDGNIEIKSRSAATTLFVTRFVTDSVDSVTIVDNGIIGSTIDAQSLLFLGGQDIIAGTLTSKDNTLFLGNIKQNVPNIGTLIVTPPNKLKDVVRATDYCRPCIFKYSGVEFTGGVVSSRDNRGHVANEAFYDDPVDNNRSSYQIKSFKAREEYRLGFVAQYNTGQWSEAVWLGDYEETYAPGRNVFAVVDSNNSWIQSYRKPGFAATLPQAITSCLVDAGFIRVAPIVVFPSDADRNVLYQGILGSTVYNVYDRGDNSPFAQADWRFRMGYNWKNIVGEIQCNPFGYANTLPNADGLNDNQFEEDFATEYYRDPSVLTFHCPDIEARDDIYQSDFEGLKMRIVGITNGGFSEGAAKQPDVVIDTYLETKTQGFDPVHSTVVDYSSGSRPSVRVSNLSPSATTRYVTGDTDLSYGGFIDNSVEESTASGHEGEIQAVGTELYKWTTYLWHRNGSLNNQPALSAKAQKAGSIRYGLLGKKIISEIRYARTTFFQNYGSFGPFEVPVNINTPKLVDSNQLNMEKIDVGASSGLLYYGNIDKVLVPNFKDLHETPIVSEWNHTYGYNLSNGYPIYAMGHTSDSNNPPTSGGGGRRVVQAASNLNYAPRGSNGSGDTDTATYGKDPISMKYKTSKHLVLSLSSTREDLINQLCTAPNSFKPFWKSSSCTFVNVLDGKLDSTVGGFTDIYDNSLFIAELYREFTAAQKNSKFGGQSEEAISNNIWYRCGESIPLVSGTETTIYYREGDTYVGRYDCLKSYPFTDEDQNQIVSIYSTELESRVNLDARYDKNKGLSSNLYMRPTNFNLFNHPGYEQTNQFFTFKSIDYKRYNFSDYPNLLTWSLSKRNGAEIDTWTSAYMLSTYDMDGELGEVTKLTTFNDTIYSFQPNGVAQILFNERVQIPAGDGQPIEITNGLKFGGVRYLSNQIGMTNKWSLCTTPFGIYFIDDSRDILYHFNGQQFQDLTSKNGFKTWITAHNSYEVWNPKDYGNFRTFYDKVNEDLYFVGNDEALVYSERIGAFISFMDYNALPLMVGMNDVFLTFTKDDTSGENTAWRLFSGDYNMFFGTYRPYWISFISNTDPTVDKVFNTVSWRSLDYSDASDARNGVLEPMKTFDTIRVWNDHQDTGEVELKNYINKPCFLKKKLNVFRANIPRDKFGLYSHKGLNRIRNTWTYIQLSRQKPNTDYMVFQDMDVDFFE